MLIIFKQSKKNIFLFYSSTIESAVGPIFTSYINYILSILGQNMGLPNLLSKNISVGKRLFSHPLFIKNVKDDTYFKN